jgi:Fic family protein
MTLNKSSSYVLLNILAGRNTATMISKYITNIDIRSIQRSLARLVDLGVIKRNGINNPSYDIVYSKLAGAIIPEKLIIDESRPESSYNFEFIDWLKAIPENELESILGFDKTILNNLGSNDKMTTKDLEYLTIELSWKSSALEGNTYTLLDTQLLLLEGIKAKDKTEFETQMILNHKSAISFIVENRNLFEQDIKFSTLEELHRIISQNLGIDSGLRKKIIRISASNYRPLSNYHQLKEHAESVLGIISNINNPVLRALIALALVPYLQTFEDGNKRTGRMLANGILIHSISRGFSLRRLTARQLALAYLSFYEFNSLKALSDLLVSELSRPL